MMLYSIFFILSISVKLGFCWPTYYYYDRNNTNGVFLVNGSVLSISTFDWTRKTNIIIHGFNDAFDSWYCTDIKNRLLELENSNVIIVDWSAGAAGPLSRYPVAAANVKVVGKKVAAFMLDNYLYPSLTYCIGYSLGAHGCGFLGKQILGLARITGLDPAGPLFALQSSSNRLAPTDATMVDCIHTSLLGVQLPICTKDFYPNGGINQPGCPTITDGGVCNHRKAVTYFIESMSDSEDYYFASKICYEVNGFFNGTCKCDPVFGCSRMGYYANLNNQTGRFFLNTYTSATCSGQTGSNSIRNIILIFAFFTLIFSCFYICFVCICLGFIRRRRDRKQSKSECQLESELQSQSQTQCQLELQPQLEVLEIQSQLEYESQPQPQLQSQSELELESQSSPSN